MENKGLELEAVEKEFLDFKQESTKKLELNIANEIATMKKNIPEEVVTDELEHSIQEKVALKLEEFNRDIDIKPKALYYSVKAELESNEEADDKQLRESAYKFLESKTSNKMLKKILKELLKENEQ